MTELITVREEIAKEIREFNAGTSKCRTATELSTLVYSIAMRDITARCAADMLRMPSPGATAALRMIRETVESLFGPYADLASEDAVLKLYGPTHEGEGMAICHALKNVGEFIGREIEGHDT